MKGRYLVSACLQNNNNGDNDCLALGAICFITKPTDIVELKEILRTIMDNAHGDITEALKELQTAVSIYY